MLFLSFGLTMNIMFYSMQALFVSMDQYLQGLFLLSNDPSAEVRKLVSILFVHLCINDF